MTDVRSARTGGADYRPMTESTLASYLAGFAEVAAILGAAPQDWNVSEVGDGNLNLVFIVRGPKGALIVKQALPYVRLVGDGWPLPLGLGGLVWFALPMTAGALLLARELPRIDGLRLKTIAAAAGRGGTAASARG